MSSDHKLKGESMNEPLLENKKKHETQPNQSNSTAEEITITTSLYDSDTLIPFLLAGLGSLSTGLLMNRVQKAPLVCDVPQFIAICTPLQAMKGNLDMTFTSRLGTMAHQGRLRKYPGRLKRILRNIAVMQLSIGIVYYPFSTSSTAVPVVVIVVFLMMVPLWLYVAHQDEEAWLAARQQGASLLLASILSRPVTFAQEVLEIAQVCIRQESARTYTPIEGQIDCTYVLIHGLTIQVQVFFFVYLSQVLVYGLFHYGIDPDMHAIPLLTSIGDLVGTTLLLALFYIMSYGEGLVTRSHASSNKLTNATTVCLYE
ncbi:unnamed protein product [Angiostrongylus costaricensis]|uniref:MgtE domain-containing protein n=1 Tax=Angiostrongylus costaricensis TaxID=334426 RepID=A0A0R3PD08_ANGCS|nr:unnamed protein product [Angiostrongylus costaricensis]